MKLVYRVPRSTYTYLVEGFLASDMISMRNQVLSRYIGFFKNLMTSPSREVRGLVRIVYNDPRSNTCKNLRLLSIKTNLSQPELHSTAMVKASLPVKEVPENEMWRLGLLTSLFKVRSEKYLRAEDTKSIVSMIESLCST